MELKDYEFNVHGVNLGQFYESAAIVPDGSERRQPTRDLSFTADLRQALTQILSR